MPHDDENPPWTAEWMAKARPAVEVLPPEVINAFKKGRGRQRVLTKTPVSLRLDSDVLAYFKSSGAGWQTRINAALRAAMKGA